MLGYTEEHMFPWAMASTDLGASCRMGEAMGDFLRSFSRLDVETKRASILVDLASAMCAEEVAWEQELRRSRALHEKRADEAVDAGIAEAYAHALAAARNYRSFQAAIELFGDPNEGCPVFESERDEVFYLLGLASGALAVLHGQRSSGLAAVPLDVPRRVERGASCFAEDQLWGVPTALRAAISLSIPGLSQGLSALGQSSPWDILEAAAKVGDAAGLGLARALLVQTAQTHGEQERLCAAAKLHFERLNSTPAAAEWALLDSYASAMIRHELDLTWTREQGHRMPIGEQGCPSQEIEEETLDDELLDGLGFEESDEAELEQPVDSLENEANEN